MLNRQSPTWGRIGPTLGAECRGIDLTQPLTPELVVDIKQALVRHKVLVFRDQSTEAGQLLAVAEKLGDIHIHPLKGNSGPEKGVIALDYDGAHPPPRPRWHADATFMVKPPRGSLLSCAIQPPAGGDTLWTDCISAYHALSDAMKALLGPLHSEHSMSKEVRSTHLETPEKQQAWQTRLRENPPSTHPVVFPHPVSSEPCLFVSEAFTTRIMELTWEESSAILDFLLLHLRRPEFCYRHIWRNGDVIISDNLSTQHFVVVDYLPHRRRMLRVSYI